jgi:hypothetical protein
MASGYRRQPEGKNGRTHTCVAQSSLIEFIYASCASGAGRLPGGYNGRAIGVSGAEVVPGLCSLASRAGHCQSV